MKHLVYFLVFLGVSALLVFCKTEPAKDYSGVIVGRWVVEKGLQDNDPTPRLEGFFFEFKEDGRMVSNFNNEASEIESRYILEEDVITQTGTPTQKYAIISANEQNMVLTTILNKAKFKLYLAKEDK